MDESRSISNSGETDSGERSSPLRAISRLEETTIIRKSSDVSISGWIATILGFYLFVTGFYNLSRLIAKTDSVPEILEILPGLIEDSPVANNKISVLVLISYAAGLPMFAGSALMAIGSLARDTRRLSTERTEEITPNPDEWVVHSTSNRDLFHQVSLILKSYNIDLTTISQDNTVIGASRASFRDNKHRLLASCVKNPSKGHWLVKVAVNQVDLL
jgi:hypothetical protein